MNHNWNSHSDSSMSHHGIMSQNNAGMVQQQQPHEEMPHHSIEMQQGSIPHTGPQQHSSMPFHNTGSQQDSSMPFHHTGPQQEGSMPFHHTGPQQEGSMPFHPTGPQQEGSMPFHPTGPQQELNLHQDTTSMVTNSNHGTDVQQGMMSPAFPFHSSDNSSPHNGGITEPSNGNEELRTVGQVNDVPFIPSHSSNASYGGNAFVRNYQFPFRAPNGQPFVPNSLFNVQQSILFGKGAKDDVESIDVPPIAAPADSQRDYLPHITISIRPGHPSSVQISQQDLDPRSPEGEVAGNSQLTPLEIGGGYQPETSFTSFRSPSVDISSDAQEDFTGSVPGDAGVGIQDIQSVIHQQEQTTGYSQADVGYTTEATGYSQPDVTTGYNEVEYFTETTGPESPSPPFDAPMNEDSFLTASDEPQDLGVTLSHSGTSSGSSYGSLPPSSSPPRPKPGSTSFEMEDAAVFPVGSGGSGTGPENQSGPEQESYSGQGGVATPDVTATGNSDASNDQYSQPDLQITVEKVPSEDSDPSYSNRVSVASPRYRSGNKSNQLRITVTKRRQQQGYVSNEEIGVWRPIIKPAGSTYRRVSGGSRGSYGDNSGGYGGNAGGYDGNSGGYGKNTGSDSGGSRSSAYGGTSGGFKNYVDSSAYGNNAKLGGGYQNSAPRQNFRYNEQLIQKPETVSGYNTNSGGFSQHSGDRFNQNSAVGYNQNSGGEYSQNSGGGYNQNSAVGYNQNSGGGYSQNSGGGFNQNSAVGYNQNSGGGYNQNAGGGFNQNSGGGYNQNAGGGYNQNAGGGYNQNSGGGYSQNDGRGYNQRPNNAGKIQSFVVRGEYGESSVSMGSNSGSYGQNAFNDRHMQANSERNENYEQSSSVTGGFVRSSGSKGYEDSSGEYNNNSRDTFHVVSVGSEILGFDGTGPDVVYGQNTGNVLTSGYSAQHEGRISESQDRSRYQSSKLYG